MSVNPKESNNVTMVDRSLRILEEVFMSNEPIGVSQISQNLELPKATVFRILNTLQGRSFVEKNKETDKYSLGLIFIKYGEKVKSNLSLKSICSPFMKELANTVGETVNLGIYHDDNVLTIHSEEGESSVLISKLIPISPLNCSSLGKIFLSAMDDLEIKKYFESNKIAKRTIHTITSYEEFMDEKRKILKEKISYDNEEYEYGLTCIACPIKNNNNKTIAAISISGPTSRLKFKEISYILENLEKTIENISGKIKAVKL